MLKFLRKGQGVSEYAVLIGLVVAAAVGMQLYVKRGAQALIKHHAMEFVNNSSTTIGSTKQYEPYYAESSITTKTDSSEKYDLKDGGASDKTGISSNTSRWGSQSQSEGSGDY